MMAGLPALNELKEAYGYDLRLCALCHGEGVQICDLHHEHECERCHGYAFNVYDQDRKRLPQETAIDGTLHGRILNMLMELAMSGTQVEDDDSWPTT